MDLQEVTRLFLLFTRLPQEELSSWEGLCRGALDALTPQLRPEVDTALHAQRLHTAAAAFAYADYLMLSGGGSVAGEKITIGSISLASTSGNQVRYDSQGIRTYYTQLIADLLKTPSFVFSTIPEDAYEA